MRLSYRYLRGSLRITRYQHARHGAIETLTDDTVVYVKPVWGLLKPGKVAKPKARTTSQNEPPAATILWDQPLRHAPRRAAAISRQP